MLSKGQIKKELEQFTKEEIIEALINTSLGVTSNVIISGCHEVRFKNETQDIEAASEAWKKASQAHIDYIKQIKEEYKGVNVFDLPAEVRDKIIELQQAEEQAYKYLVTLQDKIDNHYKKVLKAR